MTASIAEQLKAQLDGWRRLAAGLRGAHVLLASCAVGLPVISAALNDKHSPYVSAVGGVAAALLTAFDLRSKANRVRTAWRMLNEGVMRFETVGGNKPEAMTRLVDTYASAERIIGDVAPEGEPSAREVGVQHTHEKVNEPAESGPVPVPEAVKMQEASLGSRKP